MKIFVLGAGRMGSAVAMDLARNSDVEVGIGDLDIKRARAVAKEFGGQAFKVNVSQTDKLANVLRKYDSVVNASWYEFNLQAMKACFKAGCNYNDLGGLFHTTRKQLALNNEAKKSGVSAIVGGGESPGITNVMARLCAEELSTIESIKIYVGAKERPKQKNYSELVFPFSVSTVIDEYSKEPVEFLDGKFVELAPLSGAEQVTFPKPIGKNTVHYSIHSEPATLPFTLGKEVRNIEFKLGISEVMVNTLRPLIDMGFVSDGKIFANGNEISPKEFLVSFFNTKKPSRNSERFVCLRTIALGTKGRKSARVKADLVCGPQKKLGQSNATAYLTGIAGSIFGQLLAKGKVRTGVVAPELAVGPTALLSELKSRTISIAKSL